MKLYNIFYRLFLSQIQSYKLFKVHKRLYGYPVYKAKTVLDDQNQGKIYLLK